MDDCVAAVTAAVAAYSRREQRIKNVNQVSLVPRGRDAIVAREHICSLCNVHRTASVTFSQIICC